MKNKAEQPERHKKIILAITGASGSLYALTFLEVMHALQVEVDALISSAGRQVLRLECELEAEELPHVHQLYALDDFTAPMASGSSSYAGMAVLPCTMGTLAAIANGLSTNLIHRAADVTLKERRPLVLAARETPLNRVHLHNMLLATDAGAIICPPLPAFYHKPRSIEELARDFSCRVAVLLGFEVPGMARWQGVS